MGGEANAMKPPPAPAPIFPQPAPGALDSLREMARIIGRELARGKAKEQAR